MLGFEQTVPLVRVVQYPRVPNVMEPSMPSWERDALRKYTDLK